MKILVAGNIAAGKTTIIKEALQEYWLLASLYPHPMKYISIDDIRAEYGDYTNKGEDKARKVFLNNIKLSNHCVIECTGVGRLYSLIKPQLSHMVLVKTPISNCLERYKERGTDAIIPKSWKENDTILDSLTFINQCHEATYYNLTLLGMNKSLAVSKLRQFVERLMSKIGDHYVR